MNCLDRFLGKNSDIKFNENPSVGSRVVPYGRTDMSRVIITFLHFANAPKNIVALETGPLLS